MQFVFSISFVIHKIVKTRMMMWLTKREKSNMTNIDVTVS
jgi:hypothetical protein